MVSLVHFLLVPAFIHATIIDNGRYRIRRDYNHNCRLVSTAADDESFPSRRNVSSVRLAVSGKSSSMRITWSNPWRCNDAHVDVGTSEKDLDTSIRPHIDEPYEFTKGILPYKSGYFYHALASGLEANVRYFYRVVCDGSRSPVYFFDASPADEERKVVRAMILADHGTRSEGRKTVAAMAREADRYRYDVVLHAGDLSYANGQSREYLWDIWGDVIQPVAARLPYMVSPGNHEILVEDSGGEVGLPFSKRFFMPSKASEASASSPVYWYSWDSGLVHFISISSEHPDSDVQRDWLESDLRSVDRRCRPWVVTFAHEPIYTSNRRHGNNTKLRAWLDPLLAKYSVDFAFWGHDHAYERTYPIRNGTVVQHDYLNPAQATVHVTCGSSGWDLHDCWSDVTFSAFHNGTTWGFCTLHVENSSTATVTYINSKTGKPVDSFVLQKQPRRHKSRRISQDTPWPTSSYSAFGMMIFFIAVSVLLLFLAAGCFLRRKATTTMTGGPAADESLIPLQMLPKASKSNSSDSDPT
eukprot:m.149998 g.149998  ORF g.149998 m.149998 type:complete len:526 (+) comp38540_c0_seq1:1276-2853(+)